MADDEDFQPLCKRFRCVRTAQEEERLLAQAIPISIRYKNNWAVRLFNEWKQSRKNKSAALGPAEQGFDNNKNNSTPLIPGRCK